VENRYIDLSSYKTPEIIEPMVSENSCGELHVLQKERIRRNGAKTVIVGGFTIESILWGIFFSSGIFFFFGLSQK
jgi:hypothetical protein